MITRIFSLFYNRLKRFVSYFIYLITFKKKIVNKKQLNVISLMDNIQHYIKKEKDKFLSTYQENSQLNQNLESIFYHIEDYDKMVISFDSHFENIWKKKILIENTPIGNVFMFYNVYKRGFSYYSDVHITYQMLNAVAMKYVRIFSCRDLFMDDMITPVDNPSPLILIEQEYEKEKERKEKEKRNGIKNIENKPFKLGPFIKNKNGIKKVIGEGGNDDKNIKQHIYNVNKFIYMGKISNFSFLQKIEKRVILPNIHNSFQGLFENEHNLQKEVFSYRDYKINIKHK